MKKTDVEIGRYLEGRLAARTSGERLSFTKKGAHSVIPSVALISGQLGADGLLTDWFNPSALQKTGLDP